MSKEREKEGFLERTLHYFFSFISDKIEKEAKEKISSYISDITKRIFKKIVLSLISIVLVLVGIVFICVSTVKFLAIYTPIWTAWLIVGILLALFGTLIITFMLRRK